MRIKAYWHPTFDGLSWFNVSAPDIHFQFGRYSFMLLAWECFNRVSIDGMHAWGFVLLNLNGRSLLSITHDGARGLWL